MNTHRFLIIDDHPMMRGAFATQLEAFGLADRTEQACITGRGRAQAHRKPSNRPDHARPQPARCRPHARDRDPA